MADVGIRSPHAQEKTQPREAEQIVTLDRLLPLRGRSGALEDGVLRRNARVGGEGRLDGAELLILSFPFRRHAL